MPDPVLAVTLDTLRRLALLAALLAPVLMPATVRASSIIVPDASPTIQAALNARPDTVLVRAIVYAESPTIFAPVVLKGIPGTLHRPVVTALNIVPTSGDGGTIRIDELDPTGPLTIRNNGVRVSIVYFLSRLFGGINDVSPSATTTGITFRNCLVVGDASLKVDGDLVFDRCILEDHLTVGDGKCRLVMTHTQFQGKGKGAAVSTRGGADILSASVTDGVVRGYEFGFALSAVNSVEFVNNQVSVCTGRGIQAVGNLVRVERNQVDSCGTFGIAATAADSLLVLGNTVSACEGFGMLAEIGQRGRIAQNVVWGNGLDGIWLNAAHVTGLLAVVSNTSASNGGSGFLSRCHVGGRYDFTGNIGAGNQAFGVQWGVPEVTLVRCNDWFGNSRGPVQGLAPSAADLALDPQFCEQSAGDFQLSASSPLLDMPPCGLVGALGAGCEATTGVYPPAGTAFRLDRVGPIPASGPVRIEFELAREAAIELEIFDIQGRLVASPARGAWPAGRHVVEWSGMVAGARAAGGIYLVRYRYPGGEDRRRLVRTR